MGATIQDAPGIVGSAGPSSFPAPVGKTTSTYLTDMAGRWSRATEIDGGTWLRWAVTAAVFVTLFSEAIATLLRDWFSDPDAGHGILLAPIALWLAISRGVSPKAAPARVSGALLMGSAVALRVVAGLAAELFTLRVSMFLAISALIVFSWGARQLVHWWLPLLLLFLSIPLPAVILGTLALPLQFKASQMGAALLAWRHVPVELTGNVLHLPGRTLFVTEACSGLRSLASLLALGALIGGMWLRLPVSRVALIAATIPVAIVLNGIRVFLTGFLVYFVDPALGDGFMHATEGWLIFLFAFGIIGCFAWSLLQIERRWPVIS